MPHNCCNKTPTVRIDPQKPRTARPLTSRVVQMLRHALTLIVSLCVIVVKAQQPTIGKLPTPIDEIPDGRETRTQGSTLVARNMLPVETLGKCLEVGGSFGYTTEW